MKMGFSYPIPAIGSLAQVCCIKTRSFYAEIDLSSFPSYNDYFEPKTEATAGQFILILESMGRPDRQSHLAESVGSQSCDVFKILIEDHVRFGLRSWFTLC